MFSKEEMHRINRIKDLSLRYSHEELAKDGSIVGKVEIKRPIKTVGAYYHQYDIGMGVEHVLKLLFPVWVEMGYEVIFFSDVKSDNEYPLPESVERVVLNDIPCTGDNALLNRIDRWAVALSEHPCDVIIYNNWLDHYLLYDLMLVNSIGIPLILYTHGIFTCKYLFGSSDSSYWHHILEKCNLVLSLTRNGVDFYRGLGCNTTLVVNPSEDNLKAAEPRNNAGHKIIWFGGSATDKRPSEALEIFDEVADAIDDAELIMLGKMHDDTKDTVYSTLRKIKHSDRVSIMGLQDDVYPFIEDASVYLSTSTTESFMYSLLETQAHGLPCVMYELPYLLLVEGNNGGIISVPQMNRSAAAQALIELLTNPDKRKGAAQAARENAERILYYDIEQLWRNIFNQLTNPIVKSDEDMLSVLIEHIYLGRNLEVEEVKKSYKYRIGEVVFMPLSFLRRIITREKN